jgi:hypothetical protein
MAEHEVVLINAREFCRFYQVKLVKMALKLHNRRRTITAFIRCNPADTCSSFRIMCGLSFFLTALYLGFCSHQATTWVITWPPVSVNLLFRPAW